MLLGASQAEANGFLTPRNLWNLSVQTSYIGIMATGMVLVIITRNIDLSVGSIMGMVGMYMGLLQVEYLTPALGLGHPSIWIITVVFGIAMGALIGAFQGVLDRLYGHPVLHRHAGWSAGLARGGLPRGRGQDDRAAG